MAEITVKPGDILRLEQSDGQLLVVHVGENELILTSYNVGSCLKVDRQAKYSMRIRAEEG